MENIDLIKLKKLAGTAIDLGGIANYRKGAEAVSAFKESVTPEIMLALIERLEAAEVKCERWKEESISAHEENESITDEVARRDAAAGEPVGWQYRVSAGPQTGWSLWGLGDGREYEKSYRVERRRIYAAAQPAVLPTEKVFVDDHHKYQWADRALMLARVGGYNQAISDAKALGCQPVPVVKLPARFKPKVSSLLGKHAAIMASNSDGGWVNLKGVIEALEAAGIRYETNQPGE